MRNLNRRKYMTLADSLELRVGTGLELDLLIQCGCSLDKASECEEALEVKKGIPRYSQCIKERHLLQGANGPPWDRAVSPESNG